MFATFVAQMAAKPYGSCMILQSVMGAVKAAHPGFTLDEENAPPPLLRVRSYSLAFKGVKSGNQAVELQFMAGPGNTALFDTPFAKVEY